MHGERCGKYNRCVYRVSAHMLRQFYKKYINGKPEDETIDLLIRDMDSIEEMNGNMERKGGSRCNNNP